MKRIELLQGGSDIESTELRRLLFFNQGVPRLRIKNSNPQLDQFFSFIMTGLPAPPAKRTPPMMAMEKVCSHISRKVAHFLLPTLLQWKKRITNQAKFIWVDLASESVNPYLTFDAINSRGLPLSEFDKIKNFCILVASERGISLRAEEEWYKAITHLEDFGVSSRLEEATFISEAYAVLFNVKVSHDSVHAAFVGRFGALLKSSDAALENQLVAFVELWEPLAKSFGFITTATTRRSIHYGTLCSNGAGNWLNRLDNMQLPGITRVVLTVCHHRLPDPDFEQVVRACEIFTFRYYAVFGTRKDRNSVSILSLAHDVLMNGKGLDDVHRRICLWLRDHASLSKVIDELASGRAKYYHDRDMRGWSHCYYFLYEYELDNSPLGVAPLLWESTPEGKVNTQEHILPQKHRDGGWWESEWPNEAEADRFKHRLGNLTLTSNNSALSRKPIASKIFDPAAVHYYNHANATNSEKRVASYTNGHEWQRANILKREFDMLKFATKRWSLPCCSDNGDIVLPEEFKDIDPILSKITVAHPICVVCADEADDPEDEVIDEPVEDPNTI